MGDNLWPESGLTTRQPKPGMIYLLRATAREVRTLTSETLRTMFHAVLPGDEIAALRLPAR